MSAKITFQTSVIKAKLKALGDVDPKLEKCGKQILVIGIGEIQNFSPYDTGLLSGSYAIDSFIQQIKSGLWEVVFKSKVKYADDQEYGTRYQSGKPHRRPGTAIAFERGKQIVKEEFKS